MTQNHNRIVYFARLHWIIFLWPVLLLCAALYGYDLFPKLREPTLFIMGFSLLWLLIRWFTYYFSSLTIKEKQVIFRYGLLVRQTIDIPMGKIESIDIRQSIFGSILRYGTLVITGTGGTRHLLNNISRPLTCRRHIEEAMHEQSVMQQ